MAFFTVVAGTTIWEFLSVVVIILAIFLGIALIFGIITNPKCITGCVVFIIIVITCIYMGIKGVAKFVKENTNDNSQTISQSNGNNSYNNSLDLEDLHKLINEVNSWDDSSLSNYTKADLRILRNMVFAEKGFRIQKAGLKEYFEQKSWYNPYIDNQNDISLNIKEKRFLEAVQKYEEN